MICVQYRAAATVPLRPLAERSAPPLAMAATGMVPACAADQVCWIQQDSRAFAKCDLGSVHFLHTCFLAELERICTMFPHMKPGSSVLSICVHCCLFEMSFFGAATACGDASGTNRATCNNIGTILGTGCHFTGADWTSSSVCSGSGAHNYFISIS